ncbi:hypothetical protein C9374_000294 [Naegleria lovaniensis]|uniref:PH domain-containing protein n=1 Tax=Naegleria lovaniensis TaxID=51637 RepID=A0AA88KMD7_NAELO|nr:uncharacterized protein C9374_000294 [Naegleria lovaniensis]KAG2388855.1 hypothetical protein C9374_000294 [Naegleria lovaniensis]
MSSEKKVKKAGKKWKEILEEPPKVSATELMRDHDYMGTLAKQGGSIKTWHDRLCILHQGKLYYYVSQKDTKPKGMINIQGLTCEGVELSNYKKKYGIKIISPHRTYYLACEDMNEQERWIKEINNSSMRNSDYRLHVVDPDSTEDCTFHDLQKAIDQAKDGDHIVLRSGIYKLNETLMVKKPLTIRGVYPDMDLVHICSCEGVKTIMKIDAWNENLTVQELEKQRLLGIDRNVVCVEHLTLTQNASKDTILFYENTSCLEVVSGICKLDHVVIRGGYGNGIVVNNRLRKKAEAPVNGVTTTTMTSNSGTSSSSTDAPIHTSDENQLQLDQAAQHSSNSSSSSPSSDMPVKKPPIEPTKLMVSECHIECNKIHGIKFCDDSQGEISKSIFQKNEGHAIICMNDSDVKIERSVFSNHSKNAIYLQSTKTITVFKNKMHANGLAGKAHIGVAADAAPCASEENEFL